MITLVAYLIFNVEPSMRRKPRHKLPITRKYKKKSI